MRPRLARLRTRLAQAGRVRPVLACAINCAACPSCMFFLLGLTARYNRTVSAFRESPPPSPQPRVGRRARGEDTTNGTVLHGRARVWASDLWFFALGPCFLQAPLSTNISGSGNLVSTLSSLGAGVRLLDAAAVEAHDLRRAGCAGRMCEVVAGRSSAIFDSSTRMRPRWARVWGFDSSWPREANAAFQLFVKCFTPASLPR